MKIVRVQIMETYGQIQILLHNSFYRNCSDWKKII